MNVKPVVIVDCFTTREWFVDVSCFGKVINKRIQRRIPEQTTNGWEEEALDTVLDDVHSEFHRVRPFGPWEVVLNLVDAVRAELRQIHGQADSGSGGAGIETG